MSKRKKWRCFHCGEVFTNDDVPACISPLRFDEKLRLRELHEAESKVLELMGEVEKLELDAARADIYDTELRRYFGEDCSSMARRTQPATDRVATACRTRIHRTAH